MDGGGGAGKSKDRQDDDYVPKNCEERATRNATAATTTQRMRFWQKKARISISRQLQTDYLLAVFVVDTVVVIGGQATTKL